MRLKLRSFLIVFALFLSLLFLWSCSGPVNYLDEGYRSLKSGDLNSAENYFIIIMNNSSNPIELSEASEGFGWVGLLKGMYSTAEDYFHKSLFYNHQNADAYLGLLITAWETSDWNNLIFAAQDFSKLVDESYKFQSLPQREIKWLDCMKLLAMGYFMENQIDNLKELLEQLPSDAFTENLREVIE